MKTPHDFKRGVSIGTGTLCVCVMVLTFMPAIPSLYRIILGTIVTAMLPGYLWTFVFFRDNSISSLERFAMGIALSIAVTAVTVYASNVFLHIRFTNHTILGEVCVISLVGTGIALTRFKTTG
ncbi:MAG: DUF1616 domain-containing protein [Candidatus Kerfeldbacteria bacterium]